MIQKLQKLGYAVYLNGKDQIKVVSDKPDARDVELKINAHLTRSPILSQSLQA